MPPQEWSKILAASVVPVVVISACGLLCLAFYNRLTAIVSRLRSFQREQLDEQQEYARCLFAGKLDQMMLARHHRVLEMLQGQTIGVIRRARLIRLTLFFLLGAIGCLTVSSLATGLSMICPWVIWIASIFFFMGMALVLLGVLSAMLEMKNALEPVELQSQFISRLTKEFEDINDRRVQAREKVP